MAVEINLYIQPAWLGGQPQQNIGTFRFQIAQALVVYRAGFEDLLRASAIVAGRGRTNPLEPFSYRVEPRFRILETEVD